MTDRELELRLEKALSAAAPNDVEGVLSRCEARKGIVIPMEETDRRKNVEIPGCRLPGPGTGGRGRSLLLPGQRGGLGGVPGCEPKHRAGSQPQ